MKAIIHSRLFTSVLIGSILVGFAGLVFSDVSPRLIELQKVSVVGDLEVAQRREVIRLLSVVDTNNLTLSYLKETIEREPWVSRVTIERRWPDGASVSVYPEAPIALWNDDAFLNEDGEVFASQFISSERLPQLYGPVGKEQEVMLQYRQLNAALFKVGQTIELLTLDSRGSWQFETNLGVNVLLGNGELMARVQRLLRAIDHISTQGELSDIEYIDTRYGNGVAVRWRDSANHLLMSNNDNSQREP